VAKYSIDRIFSSTTRNASKLDIVYNLLLLSICSKNPVMTDDTTGGAIIPLPTSCSADLVMDEGATGSWHDSFVPSPYSCSSGYATPDVDNVVHLPVMQSVDGEDLSPPGVGSPASNEQSPQEFAFTPGMAGQSGSMEPVKDVRRHETRPSGRVSKAKKGLKIHKCDCGRVSVSDVSLLSAKSYNPLKKRSLLTRS
jgi:hypothetical protein